MARPCPQTTSIETTVKLLSCIFVVAGNLSRLVIGALYLVEDPLLLIGKKLDDYDDEHALAESLVITRELVAGDARGEEKDVGRRCDDPQENLDWKLDVRGSSVLAGLTFCAKEMKATLKMNMTTGPT